MSDSDFEGRRIRSHSDPDPKYIDQDPYVTGLHLEPDFVDQNLKINSLEPKIIRFS